MKKWWKEIKKVGFYDWCWFVVYLRRDEFSKKLNYKKYYPDIERLCRDRDRAHRIDDELNGGY